MDWSKAKNILIVALLATNIFLLFTYMTKNESESSITDHDVLFTVLEGKNIFVDTELSQKQERMPAIIITYNKGDEELIEKNLKSDKYNVPEASESEAYRRAAVDFLKDSRVADGFFTFDQVVTEEEQTSVLFKNCYKNTAIGGSTIEVTFDKGALEDVTRQFVTSEPKSKKKLEVISPEEALLMFMSQKSKDEVVHIERMELVYWVNDSSFDGEALISDTAFPAWKITYNNGKIKYIDAYRA